MKKRIIALLLAVVMAAGLLPVTAAAQSSTTDLSMCYILLNGARTQVYSVDNLTDTLTIDDLNITVMGLDGQEVPAASYTLTVGKVTGWDVLNNEPLIEEIPAPYGLSVSEVYLSNGYGSFGVYATANDGGGYRNVTMVTEFMIWHKYCFNNNGATVTFGAEYLSDSRWFEHDYYQIPQSKIAAPAVYNIADELVDPSQYTITYYKRADEIPDYDDPDFEEKLYPTDDPLPGLPTETGEYFARVEAKSPYYGTGWVDFDIVDDPPLLGDADGNGAVEAIDATLLQRYDAEIWVYVDEDVLMNADIDGSGDLDITDATFIQRWLAEMPVPFAVGQPKK